MQCVAYIKHYIGMIEIKNLKFGYPGHDFIFNKINLSIQNGIYIMLGENGVGKTTLLHLLSSLRFPNAGDCLINHKNTCSRSPDLLRELFFLPEEFNCPGEPIASFAARHSKFYPSFDPDLLTANLDEMEIDRKKNMSDLSFGQRKKAMIAYALALKTPLLLLDEPTNGLDILSKQTLQRILARHVGDHQTLVISTHSIQDFKNLYDHLIFLVDENTVINASLEKISSRLLFAYSIHPPKDALYAEQTLEGYASILSNRAGIENTIDPELLYRGLLRDTRIKDLLTDK